MNKKEKKNNPNRGLSFLYNTAIGRIILKLLVTNKFINKISGMLLDSKLSKFLIKPFIKKYNIDMSLFEDEEYKNFNDFFIRKIKDEKRPIARNKKDFISCADSKLTVYKINKSLKFNVKNSTYNVFSILNDKNLAKEYEDGYLMVFRLSPNDYHRYCFVDDAKLIHKYHIKGRFHTVNPISYDKFEIFKENTRCCSIYDTKNFGKLIYIEVGALLVGKIVNHSIINAKKGVEKGYFKYGGSTVIILIKPNIIDIEPLILKNSKKGNETYVNYGQKIGQKK